VVYRPLGSTVECYCFNSKSINVMTSIETKNVPLPKPLRTQLENTVKAARDVAEKAGRATLTQLAVSEAKAPDYLSADQKALRRSLRAHGRALGDAKHTDDTQELQHLVWEVAYEHWHRMLFARFLAENNLLMWEPGAAVSLDDCRDMVDNHPDMAMGAKSHWELAGKLAARMLPQVFKPQSPVFELSFAPEDQRALEKLLANLPTEVFQASDSLGWVYQFWQAKRKDEVNASGNKIGADELPAVTQLFTEPYMVDFLLHNSLGAWWLTRHPDTPCPVPMPYLRTLEDGTPAAGNFEGWPDTLKDFKLLDPSCGSGHFLVAAFLLLVPLRMADEGLTALDAVDLVLQNNLHGLEIDPRCVEIAVFALALAAWRYPDEDGNPLGVRADMPALRIACCGLKVAGRAQDWAALVPDTAPNAEHLRQGLNRLHDTFAQAPLLGSLLDPSKANRGDLFAADYSILGDLLQTALSTEQQVTLFDEVEGRWDLALSAQGLLEAARLLDQRYHLVITNVPYLARGKQEQALKVYCELHYPNAKNDLANVFLERCLELTIAGPGVVQIVMPQNWLFLTSYKKQRENLLKTVRWDLLARLGEGGFDSPQAAGAFIILLTQTRIAPDAQTLLHGLDASAPRTAQSKAECLLSAEVKTVSQAGQLGNPDARIVLTEEIKAPLLSYYSSTATGMQTFDRPRFLFQFWELARSDVNWPRLQSTVDSTTCHGGHESIVRWQNGQGDLAEMMEQKRLLEGYSTGIWRAGTQFWKKSGVLVSLMRNLPTTVYIGGPFDNNTGVIIPKDESHIDAVWCYCSSPEFNQSVRRIDQKLNVTNATLVKVPFDLAHWQQVAAERYPNGLPKPYSDDPTQWLFHGHPQPAIDPLQVAVARLLGYVWPAETDDKMELSDEARGWIARCAPLAKHTDDDGIVCLQPVRGEKPAYERLLALLIDAWETVTPGSWTPSVLDKLLAQADCAGKGLAVWLREQFFEQHAKRFQHRPFIWHVWDGQKDGFGALVNAHKLDAKNLERLIHTYLGDWIRTQEAGVASGTDGAPLRLSAAQNLKTRLQAILEGEAPYDIFVRWKPLAEQAIGWNPDLNDGVRMNIRPFMTAEVLRHNKKPKLNITWDKDRGKDVESAPWFKVFGGERINDHHLTLALKATAKAKSNG
jgi:hypothetical protein